MISTPLVETVVKTGDGLSFLLRIGNDSNGLMATILTYALQSIGKAM